MQQRCQSQLRVKRPLPRQAGPVSREMAESGRSFHLVSISHKKLLRVYGRHGADSGCAAEWRARLLIFKKSGVGATRAKTHESHFIEVADTMVMTLSAV